MRRLYLKVVLEPYASQKYGNIRWVFEALCVFIFLCYLLGLTSFGAGGQHIEGNSLKQSSF